MAQTIKRLPARQETQVQSLGQEDPLEKEMATHSSILACKIPQTEKPGRLQCMGSQRVGHDWATSHGHQLNRREFEQTPEDSEGQGSLACCSPRDHKESDTTQQLNSERHQLRYNWVQHYYISFRCISLILCRCILQMIPTINLVNIHHHGANSEPLQLSRQEGR